MVSEALADTWAIPASHLDVRLAASLLGLRALDSCFLASKWLEGLVDGLVSRVLVGRAGSPRVREAPVLEEQMVAMALLPSSTSWHSCLTTILV